MNTFLLAPPIFFVIAFVFSMLGMGGSQLYIPILYWMGMDFKTEAIPLGMLLNVANSSSAAITYGRKKLIKWQVAIPFAAAMILFAPLGVWLNVHLPVKPLLVFFALFTAAAAILMLSGWKPKRGAMSSRGRVLLGVTAGSGLGTIAGMIPIALEQAVGLERLSPLADVAVGGLLVGTLLTLVYVPMYAYITDPRNKQ